MTPTKKLGMVGGKKSSPARPKSPTPLMTPKKKIGTIGGGARSPVAVAQPTVPSPVTTPKKKLGTIGGMRKPSPAPTEEPAATTSYPLPTSRKKLGVIGGSKSAQAATPVEHKDPPQKTSTVKAEVDDVLVPETQLHNDNEDKTLPPSTAETNTTQQERETSVERAARKREELKRQLDDRTKVNANKKKRRF